MNILYIEDTKSSRDLVKINLKKKGYKVDTAITVYEAIKKMKKNKYDIILLDIFLTDASGYDVAIYARQELNLTTPIIAVTAIKKEYTPSTKMVGMNDFIQKPIDFDVLINRMEKLTV